MYHSPDPSLLEIFHSAVDPIVVVDLSTWDTMVCGRSFSAAGGMGSHTISSPSGTVPVLEKIDFVTCV